MLHVDDTAATAAACKKLVRIIIDGRPQSNHGWRCIRLSLSRPVYVIVDAVSRGRSNEPSKGGLVGSERESTSPLGPLIEPRDSPTTPSPPQQRLLAQVPTLCFVQIEAAPPVAWDGRPLWVDERLLRARRVRGGFGFGSTAGRKRAGC